ncbi:hypothetical protein R84981_002612 [Carnimonas sp. R-84981]
MANVESNDNAPFRDALGRWQGKARQSKAKQGKARQVKLVRRRLRKPRLCSIARTGGDTSPGHEGIIKTPVIQPEQPQPHHHDSKACHH